MYKFDYNLKDFQAKSPLGRLIDRHNLKRQKRSILLNTILICLVVILFVNLFEFNSYRAATLEFQLKPPKPQFVGSKDGTDEDLKGFCIKTEGCRIPDLNPFDPAIKKYIFKEKKIKCNKGKPALMDSNLTSIFTIKESIEAYNITNASALDCCYKVFERREPKKDETDKEVEYHKDCIKFNGSATIKDEFIEVNCKYYNDSIYTDMFSFVPIKFNISAKRKSSPLNVLVLGIDTVSRLNFYRQMPKTVKVLQNLRAVELLGYNKIGDNTFTNLVGVLTGYSDDELLKLCYKKNERFDTCPFLWKKYNESGYVTAFGEDAAWMGLFNYNKRGFLKQPTDYYWSHFSYHSEKKIGNAERWSVEQCVGARLSHTNFLQFADKFVNTMNDNKVPYFGFFWSSSLSHDYLNKPNLGDEDFADFLNTLVANGTLNNTILFVMSDHGIRWGNIRDTYQGRLEERIPFVFIKLPKQLRDQYSQAFNNLKKNTRRLTTPFDLYETFKHFLNLSELSTEKINERVKNRNVSRGYSLFDPIPLNRTCKSADITPHWCTCQNNDTINTTDSIVKEATQFVIDHINKKLEGYAACAKLTLAKIYNATLYTFSKSIKVGKTDLKDFTIIFTTTPGNARLEANVRQNITAYKTYNFTITGDCCPQDNQSAVLSYTVKINIPKGAIIILSDPFKRLIGLLISDTLMAYIEIYTQKRSLNLAEYFSITYCSNN